ncbi:MAG: energy transducer TonB [Candidatus Eremiobacteraeota bacterium]|nr:energy transducer TonB [Candidatus Eremiobacteraeota bacterium]
MNSSSRIAVALGTLAFAAASLPLGARPLANDYTPPKLVHQGTTSKSIAGKGTVVVQVEVSPNGAHKVTRLLKSTNSGDNGAALEIAQNSSYRAATRAGKAVLAFYDFTLKFNGKTVAAVDQGASGNDTGARIARMIRAGNYAGAKAAAAAHLAANASDQTALEQTGVADYFLKDYAGSAAAFAKVGQVSKTYATVAAHAYASAAVASGVDSATAVAYGRRALALNADANAYYALGVADLSANDATGAVTNLKRARDLGFADPKTDKRSKENLDTVLYNAYVKAGNLADANAIAAEIKALDPSSTLAEQARGRALLDSAEASMKANKVNDALADFDRAAALNNPQFTVTADYQAALLVGNPPDGSGLKPDYTRSKAYADKALAANAQDPLSNFAEGYALIGQYATGGKKDAQLKSQAQTYLTKAASEAQAQHNDSLYQQIEKFIKDYAS